MNENSDKHSKVCAYFLKGCKEREIEKKKERDNCAIVDGSVISLKQLVGAYEIKYTSNYENGDISISKRPSNEPKSTDFESGFVCLPVSVFLPSSDSDKIAVTCKTSTGSSRSSMSTEFAQKLGLQVKETINATGFRTWAFEGGLPVTYVVIETNVTVNKKKCSTSCQNCAYHCGECNKHDGTRT